ncbi:hypothetical protein ACWGLF_41855 [Streptomyces puniciscabiei]
MEVEGQVSDGVEADLDGLELVRSQPEAFGIVALGHQCVREGADGGAQRGWDSLDAAFAAGGGLRILGAVGGVQEVVGVEEVGERSAEPGTRAG